MIKNISVYSVIAVIVVGGALFWMSRDNQVNNTEDTSVLVSSTPTPSPIQSSIPIQTSKLTKSTPKPSPKIIVTEVNQYQPLVDWLEPLNRRLTLDENCTSIVPSQLAYPNNTQIMLDNTLSASPRVLKIGAKEYSLAANGWLLVTLSSTKLPAQLTMFCGPMELGQLDLE